MTADRISATFASCAAKGRAAFVGYLMAGVASLVALIFIGAQNEFLYFQF